MRCMYFIKSKYFTTDQNSCNCLPTTQARILFRWVQVQPQSISEEKHEIVKKKEGLFIYTAMLTITRFFNKAKCRVDEMTLHSILCAHQTNKSNKCHPLLLNVSLIETWFAGQRRIYALTRTTARVVKVIICSLTRKVTHILINKVGLVPFLIWPQM